MTKYDGTLTKLWLKHDWKKTDLTPSAYWLNTDTYIRKAYRFLGDRKCEGKASSLVLFSPLAKHQKPTMSISKGAIKVWGERLAVKCPYLRLKGGKQSGGVVGLMVNFFTAPPPPHPPTLHHLFFLSHHECLAKAITPAVIGSATFLPNLFLHQHYFRSLNLMLWKDSVLH